MQDTLKLLSVESALRRGEILLTFALITVLIILILPMPEWLLDFSLALSITFSVMILITTLFIERPLDFTSFPMVLLVATIFRLALNVASTRLILSQGHAGPTAAGKVIYAFGTFIMQGNFVIGLIVFAILVIINFVVITKGSGRIAEVSARFSLDALPGRQMAIDADLNAGVITDIQAKALREELQIESGFYGAMDGAAKFVRGDAVAGLMITFINIIGGILIGVLQQGISLSQAAASYTFLTVGDGLVSQIPGLIISVAAGLIISKGSTRGSADKALFGQLSAYPTALAVCGVLLLAFGTIPGIPFIPFFIVAAGMTFVAYIMFKRDLNKGEDDANVDTEAKKKEEADKKLEATPIEKALGIDIIRIEFGYNLLSMLDKESGKQITNHIKSLRDQFALDLGFILPSVRMQDNLQLPHDTYVIRIKEVEAARGTLRANLMMAMNPEGGEIRVVGEETKEPVFNLPAKWISKDLVDDAEGAGCTVVDPSTVLTTHLTEVVKTNIGELLSYADLQNFINTLSEEHKKLVSDIVPSQLSKGAILRVLQNLLSEQVSIRDLPTILEAIAESGYGSKSITAITEYVRARLARQISAAYMDESNILNIIPLSPYWEQEFANSIQGDISSVRELTMAPSKLQEFTASVEGILNDSIVLGKSPVILTSPSIRPFIRAITERLTSSVPVLSQAEIHPKASIRTLTQI